MQYRHSYYTYFHHYTQTTGPGIQGLYHPPTSPLHSSSFFFLSLLSLFLFPMFRVFLCDPDCLEFMILLSQASKCWDHRGVSSGLAPGFSSYGTFCPLFSDLLNLLKQTPPNIPPSSSATHSFGSLLGLQGCWPSFMHPSSALGCLLDYSLG